MSKFINFLRQGITGAPEGSEKFEKVLTPPFCRIINDAKNNLRAQSLFAAVDVFNLLPAASATAGKDDLMFTVGTGTEVIARATKGGINVKTQASTPADNDNAILIPATSSNMYTALTAVSQPRFTTRVNLTQITELFFSAGFDENITSPDPAGTAGDGAKFYFDPAGENSTGLAAGTRANWILSHKIAGADTFIDSGIPVQIARDYELEIQYGVDLKPTYYIDGVNVGTGAAGTTTAVIGAVIGVQINAGSPAGQKDFDVRYVMVERFIG